MNLSDVIINVSENKEEFDFSTFFTEKQGYTFLVGAGISMDPPSNVPSARMFVRELFTYYAPKEELEYLESLESLRYEFLVEKIQSLFDNDLTFLDYLDLIKEPNDIHLFLTNMVFRYNYIITTNFDYLIETAMKNELSTYPMYHSYHKNFMIIITKEDFENDVRLKFPIIKIHGSKYDCIKGRYTADSLVTTLSALGKERERGKTFAIEPYKRRIIDDVTRDKNLVVMGYSGNDDFDISPMLRELNLNKMLLWIDHDPNKVIGSKEEVYQYNPIENPNDVINSNDFTKLDKLLIELASTKNLKVIKIKANTIEFVRSRLAPIYKARFDRPKRTISKETMSFNDYMKEHYIKKAESSKYRLAHEIYSELGDIPSAERTAYQGLNVAKQENDQIGEVYFTNAIGLIELSKGNGPKALSQFEQTLQLIEKTHQVNEKIAVLHNIGEYYRKQGDLKNAFKYVFEANSSMKEDTPNTLKLSILNSLGVLYNENGDIPNAIKSLEAALVIAEKLGDLFSKALMYNNLSGINLSQGLLEPALKYASESLKIDKQLGNLDDMASNLNTIGNIYRTAGYYDQALQYLQKAYTLSKQIQKLSITSLSVNTIGGIYFQLGKYDLAMEKYTEAYEIRKAIGDLSGQTTSLNNISLIYHSRRDYMRALEFINQSIALSEEIGEKKYLGVRYGNRASIYQTLNIKDKALEDFKKALSIEESQGHMEGIASQLTNIAGILGDMGKHDETFEYYTKVLNILENLGIKPGIANSLNNLGVIYYKYKKDYEKAIDYLQRAVEIYKEINLPNKLLETMNNLNVIKQKYESQKK